jgi:hypothetical protein
LAHRTYQALANALRGELDAAAHYLDQVLTENPIFLLGQAARFYILMRVGDLLGAIAALSDILGILEGAVEIDGQGPQILVNLVESACRKLQEHHAQQEHNLILAGALQLENMLQGQMSKPEFQNL